MPKNSGVKTKIYGADDKKKKKMRKKFSIGEASTDVGETVTTPTDKAKQVNPFSGKELPEARSSYKVEPETMRMAKKAGKKMGKIIKRFKKKKKD